VHPQRSVANDAAAAELSTAARKSGQTVWSGAPRAPPSVPDGSACHPQAGGGPQSELPGSCYGASSDATAAPSPPAPLHAAAGNDLPVGGWAGAAARANPPAVPIIAPVSETPGNNWARLFAYVGAVFDATPRYQLISVLVKAGVWPSYLINFAAGRSVHSPPATKRGLEPWFLDVLRDALPAGINGEIVGSRAHRISAASHCTSAAFLRPSHFRKLRTTGLQMSSYVSPDAWILCKEMSSF